MADTGYVANTILGEGSIGGAALDVSGATGSNTALGYQCLFSLTSGADNIAIGHEALYALTTGGHNVAVGKYTGETATTAIGNTLLGSLVCQGLTGGYNTVVGGAAGVGLTSGTYNTLLGYNCGPTNMDTGNYNILIGYLVDTSASGASNEINIGNIFRGSNSSGSEEMSFQFDKPFYFGAGKDAYLQYDGTDMKLVTDAVAASDFVIDCGTQKTIELAEVVYKDINMGAAQLSKPAASAPGTDEFKDEGGTDTGIETLAFAVGEKVSGSFEIQHDYKEGTDLTFHVHWQGIAAPTGTDNVQWQLVYAIGSKDATLDSATTITSGDTSFDTQYDFKLSSFSAIDGSTAGNNGGGVVIGDQFLFQLSRIAASGDAYAGEALIATAGLHYQVDTLGSRQIGTK